MNPEVNDLISENLIIFKKIESYISYFQDAPEREDVKKSLEVELNSNSQRITRLQTNNAETALLGAQSERENLLKEIEKVNNLSEENFNILIQTAQERIKSGNEIKVNQSLKEEEKSKVKLQFLELISGKDKKWGEATELLVDYVKEHLILYTTKEDRQSEVWVYNEGIYVPQGKSEIKKVLREVLEEYYSSFVLTKVIDKIEPDTFIDSKEFFNKNYVNEISMQNGILDIFTLEIKPFNPKKVFFNKLPVNFDSNAKCPKIEKFLKEVLLEEEDIKVFYEIAGFSLLKEYRYEKAFMFVGNGRNGKDKSLELIKRLVGVENCSSLPLTSLTPESFGVSELYCKMVNIAGDIGNQDLKDTSAFKALTGRSLISGKRKFLNDVVFTNYAKFIFACNELPMVYDLSKGFWDRWALLEFPYTFVPKKEYDISEDKTKLKIRDENIISKITSPEEMSGFLNQALAGLSRLIKQNSFSSTKGSEEVKNTWIRRSNSFIAFCFDNLEEDYENRITKKELRKKYHAYCKKHKVPSKTDYVIKKTLQEMFGVVEERPNTGKWIGEWVWTGINFKFDSEKKKSKIKICESCSKPSTKTVRGIPVCDDCFKLLAEEDQK